MTLFAKAAAKITARMEQLATDTFALAEKVSPEVRESRYNICLSCEKLYAPTKTCRLCGCFMNIKTWMPNQNCPVNKWGKAPADMNKQTNEEISEK